MAAGTGMLVIAGRWANAQPLDIKIVVGVGAYAISLSLLSQADDTMAAMLAAIVFFAACGLYLPGLVQKMGWGGSPAGATAVGTGVAR